MTEARFDRGTTLDLVSPTHAVARALEKTSDFMVGVPDSGLVGILEQLHPSSGIAYAPREDIAVAMGVGAWLGGRRPLVFLKNAGLAAALDAVISVAIACRAGLTLLVGWSGAGTDFLPHHRVIGSRTEALLDAARIAYVRVSPENVPDPEVLEAFARGSHDCREVRAILHREK